MKPCSVCNENANHKIYQVPEMTTGTHEVFPYQQCSKCGFIELLEVPPNMSKYYADDYYSFGPQGKIKGIFKAWRGAAAFGSMNPVSRILHFVFGDPPVAGYLKKLPYSKEWRILDVGCGQGIALRDLNDAGFAALHGVDPHLRCDQILGNVTLQKKEFFEVSGKYDLIFLNHSYEHMPNQKDVLNHAGNVIENDGWLVIRMPTIGASWKRYGVHWFSLHAPRHFSIHSLATFKRQLQDSPFELVKFHFDSDWNHNLSSKKYKKGYTNRDPRYVSNTGISQDDFANAKQEAEAADIALEGDQATFYLQKKSNKQRKELVGP
jgi:2-polyprenyl-3-methyl-5-hydroxy-6-metoxy-1,4-benzoquinol methylase